MSRRGLSLREIVVVAGLAAILLLLFVMWLGRTRAGSRRNLCQRRQQQTAGAIMQYEALRGNYPGYRNLQAVDAGDRRRAAGWVFGLLPYLGYDVPRNADKEVDLRELASDPNVDRPYQQLYEDYGPDGDDGRRGATPRARIVELICPADPRRGASSSVDNAMSWVVNTGMPDAEKFGAGKFGALPADWNANGIFQNQFDEHAASEPLVSADWLSSHDGLESTLLMSENVDAGKWTGADEPLVGFMWVAELVEGIPAPGDRLLRINRLRGHGDGGVRFARPSSFHAGGVNAVFASGRTQFLSEEIDWLVFARLMSSDGANAKFPGTDSPVPPAYR